MEKFAGYGFNKSHAAAYALISYQTAWLKAHYPAEFMAATMSSELDNTDQLKHFYDDCRANGIEFLPPDINESDYRFTPYPNMKIRYALGAIKGTGEAAVESIIAARQSGGKFTGLLDFCERVGKEHIEPPHPRSPDPRRTRSTASTQPRHALGKHRPRHEQRRPKKPPTPIRAGCLT